MSGANTPSEEQRTALAERVADHTSVLPFPKAAAAALRQEVDERLALLSPGQRRVREMALASTTWPRKREEVAAGLGVRREQIRQTERRALRKLCDPAKAANRCLPPVGGSTGLIQLLYRRINGPFLPSRRDRTLPRQEHTPRLERQKVPRTACHQGRRTPQL